MAMLGRYERRTELSHKNAGTCEWCFAVRGGQEYFIKAFKDGPKYPENDTTSKPEKIAKKIQKCKIFEQKKTRVYRTINEYSDGNVVRVVDFFRVGSLYYMAMPKIKAVKMTPEEISKLPEYVKRRICTVIAHSVAQLHDGHFVHADIKHSNIMLVHSRTSKLTAKLIDFDAGFFEDDPPANPEEIAGDLVYFSPEVYHAQREESMCLTCKMDVFALGVLFHQYLTGKVPQYKNGYESTGEAVSFGETALVSWDMPEDLHRILCRMLASNPEERPTAREVYDVFSRPLKKEHDSIPKSSDPPITTATQPKPEAKTKNEKVVCPHCGARHIVGTVSCKYCGTAIGDKVVSTASRFDGGAEESFTPQTTPKSDSAGKVARKAICPHCGARQSEDAVICKYCGTSMHG